MPDGSDKSFAGHPQTVSELRANRDANASAWTPRDVLVSVLRDIDEGKFAPDALIVIHREFKSPGHTSSHYAASAPDVHATMGMLAYAQFQVGTGAGDQ